MKRSLFSYRGRIGRLTHFITILLMIVAVIATVILGESLDKVSYGRQVTAEAQVLVFLGSAFVLALNASLVWVISATLVKRLHDIDMSAWWALLLGWIPMAWLVLCFVPGTRSSNRFGGIPAGMIFSVGGENDRILPNIKTAEA